MCGSLLKRRVSAGESGLAFGCKAHAEPCAHLLRIERCLGSEKPFSSADPTLLLSVMIQDPLEHFLSDRGFVVLYEKKEKEE